MHPFSLYRSEDATGVSGTGTVAEGVVFSNGKVALCWLGQHSSVAVWNSFDDVMTVHGHHGQTVAVWKEDEDG